MIKGYHSQTRQDMLSIKPNAAVSPQASLGRRYSSIFVNGQALSPGIKPPHAESPPEVMGALPAVCSNEVHI